MYQKEKKLNPVLLIVLAVVLLAVGIAVWFLLTHVRVAGTFYSRSAEVLDLRFADITTADYEKLRKKAPNSEILWRIPFQGKTYDQNTDVLYVTSLTDEDVATLDYFTQLKSVEAQECTDYAQLAALAARRPAVAVDYAVTIDGRKYDQDTAVVSVSDITEEEIGLLTYLPDLTAVTAVGCETPEQMEKLRDFCQEKGISFALRFGTKIYPDTVQELDVTGITDAELELLQLLPELKTLHLVNPEADPATVLQLRSTYPKVSINWEVEMAGISFPDDTKEVDLSAALEITTTDKTTTQTAATTKVTTGTVTGTQTTEEPKPAVTLNLQDLEKKMSYLPDAEQVFLGKCGLDNEELAALRERTGKLQGRLDGAAGQEAHRADGCHHLHARPGACLLLPGRRCLQPALLRGNALRGRGTHGSDQHRFRVGDAPSAIPDPRPQRAAAGHFPYQQLQGADFP